VVGDGHAMSVTAQITEHMLWASEGTFRVDHPVVSEQWSQPGSKNFRLSEELQVSIKVEFATVSSTKLAERGLKVGMSQPFLDFSRRCPAVVTVGRKVLAKPVQNPLLADRRLCARNFLAAHRSFALATVETAVEGDLLE
jgi:hypothetical protein